MGKLFANNNQLLYDPQIHKKKENPQGKQTVQKLMDFGISSPVQRPYSAKSLQAENPENK